MPCGLVDLHSDWATPGKRPVGTKINPPRFFPESHTLFNRNFNINDIIVLTIRKRHPKLDTFYVIQN